MPPRNRFSREEIIEAAFQLAREKGLAEITARNVAQQLGSSVAPIYVNFSSIEELIEAVVQRVFAISREMLEKERDADYFTRIGRASLAFAREYPVLVRELTLKPNPFLQSYADLEQEMIAALGQSGLTRGWSEEERRKLFFRMRVFQMGLMIMVANGHVPSWMEEGAEEEQLLEMGADLVEIQNLKRRERNQ